MEGGGGACASRGTRYFFQGGDAEAYKYQVVVQIMPWVPDDHIHKETIICP